MRHITIGHMTTGLRITDMKKWALLTLSLGLRRSLVAALILLQGEFINGKRN
jgi:hypothetical protein